MKRNLMRHAAAVTILAAALALAAPAPALAWPNGARASDLVHAAWSWLVGLWAEPAGTEPPERRALARQKAGPCVDPSGVPICGNQSVAEPPEGHAPIWQKCGPASDPLGQPACQKQSVAGGDAGGG